MVTRYYYAEVENIIYAFTGKKIRDYYVLLHYNLNSHTIYKKEVLKKLGKNLTFSWFGFYATVVKTLDWGAIAPLFCPFAPDNFFLKDWHILNKMLL